MSKTSNSSSKFLKKTQEVLYQKDFKRAESAYKQYFPQANRS